MLKVVLDTNVILSGSVAKRGNPHEILAGWRRGGFLLLTRDDIIVEVVDVLGRRYFRDRHHVTDEMIFEIATALKTEALQTKGEINLKAVTEDPDDDKILACAVEGQADYIVSGDHHLLDLGSYSGIPIVRPAAFLQILEGAQT